jgi:hypothetical protein
MDHLPGMAAFGGTRLDIDPEEIKQRYAELSDDGLLSIDRDDLTELAQRYYDAELDDRGLGAEALSAQSAKQPEPEPGKPDEDMVLVATFLAMHEADLALTLLRSADIPVYLENELSSAYTGLGGLRLMVPSAFVEQAEEILGAQISEEDLIAQAEAAGSLDPPDEEEARD